MFLFKILSFIITNDDASLIILSEMIIIYYYNHKSILSTKITRFFIDSVCTLKKNNNLCDEKFEGMR